MNSLTESSAPVPSSSPDNANNNNRTHDNQSTPSTDSAAISPGNRLCVAMHLSNALPEFCVETSKYTTGVMQKWRAEDCVKAMFLEDVEGVAVRKPYLGTVCGMYVWWWIRGGV